MIRIFHSAILLVLLVGVLTTVLYAQGPARLVSPEVHPDGSVTFRLRAPNATAVMVAVEGGKPQAMEKQADGTWTLKIAPLEPDLYGYSFTVDGVTITDPSNHWTKPNFIYPSSVVHVSGPASLPWEIGDVPRGTVHRHFYRSAVVGDHRDFFVYTPPGYGSSDGRYPVLYLLHGFSDDASGWTAIGRAHVIFDNLIAAGKMKPMLVVMPLGYGAPEVVTGRGTRDLWAKNMDLFRKALVEEVIPAVEKQYRVNTDRTSRAIAGLSMGGAQSLLTGLNTLDRFAWVGAFSSGGMGDDLQKAFPEFDSKANEKLKLLWIACGKDDFLIESNRKMIGWLKSKDIRHTYTETAGAHTWMVWRRYLAEFAPLLFK